MIKAIMIVIILIEYIKDANDGNSNMMIIGIMVPVIGILLIAIIGIKMRRRILMVNRRKRTYITMI